MYLKVKRIEKQKTEYGFDLVIKMISLYDNQDRFVKNCKLNDHIMESIKDGKIIFDVQKAMK